MSTTFSIDPNTLLSGLRTRASQCLLPYASIQQWRPAVEVSAKAADMFVSSMTATSKPMASQAALASSRLNVPARITRSPTIAEGDGKAVVVVVLVDVKVSMMQEVSVVVSVTFSVDVLV